MPISSRILLTSSLFNLPLSLQARVLFQHTLVHYYLQTCLSCPSCRLLIHNPFLQPDRLCPDPYSLFHYREDIRRFSQDIHNIHLFRNRGKIRITFLTIHILNSWVHRNYPVTLPLQITCHCQARPPQLIGYTHHRDTFRFPDNLFYIIHGAPPFKKPDLKSIYSNESIYVNKGSLNTSISPVASRKNLSESTIRCLMENLFEMF